MVFAGLYYCPVTARGGAEYINLPVLSALFRPLFARLYNLIIYHNNLISNNFNSKQPFGSKQLHFLRSPVPVSYQKPSTGSPPREPSSSRPSVFSPGARRPPRSSNRLPSRLRGTAVPRESPGAPGVSPGPAGPAPPSIALRRFHILSLSHPVASATTTLYLRTHAPTASCPSTCRRISAGISDPSPKVTGDIPHPRDQPLLCNAPPPSPGYTYIISFVVLPSTRQESDFLAHLEWTCEPAGPQVQPSPSSASLSCVIIACLRGTAVPRESPGAPGVSVDPTGSKHRSPQGPPGPLTEGDGGHPATAGQIPLTPSAAAEALSAIARTSSPATLLVALTSFCDVSAGTRLCIPLRGLPIP